MANGLGIVGSVERLAWLRRPAGLRPVMVLTLHSKAAVRAREHPGGCPGLRRQAGRTWRFPWSPGRRPGCWPRLPRVRPGRPDRDH